MMEGVSEKEASTGVLDLTLPKLPPRSRLYCLEPMGVGTPSVESLTGYVSRLAREHNVTPYALIKFEIAPLTPDLYTVELGGTSGLRGHAPFNYSGHKATTFVRVLERLTLTSGLKYLTLLPWGGVIPVQGLFRGSKAWCPGCYYSQYSSGMPNYDLLAWLFRRVSLCAEHGIPLAERCPYCLSAMEWLGGRSNPGFCTRCFRWLGVVNDYERDSLRKPDQEVAIQVWISKEVGKVVAQATQLLRIPSRETMTLSLSRIIDGMTAGHVGAFARRVKIVEGTIWGWRAGTLPTFDMILRVCGESGTSIYDFLAGTIPDGPLRAGCERKSESVCSAEPLKPRSRAVEFEQKVEVLNGALSETPPPSIADLAKRMGYKVSTILYQGKHRQLALKVAARHAKYQETRLKREREEVRRILLSELRRTKGRPLSISEACRLPDGKRHYTVYHNLFPDTCAAIKAKYRKYLMDEKKRKKSAIADEVRQIAIMLHRRGEFPSTPRVASLMQKPSNMSRKFARHALREAQLELGLRIAAPVR